MNLPKTLIVCATKCGAALTNGHWIAQYMPGKATVTNALTLCDPSNYDLVIIGAPIYGGKMLPQGEVYIEQYKSILATKHVALFAVALSKSSQSYTDPLTNALINPPIATAVLGGEIDPKKLSPEDTAKLITFYKKNNTWTGEIPHKSTLNKEEARLFANEIITYLEIDQYAQP